MTKIVLIVDDEPANIDLIKGLVPAIHKCKAAIKGEVALKQIAKAKPDLVILDLIMPGMDGFTTLTEIRKTFSSEQLPVLIVSGTKDTDDHTRLMDLGICGFLTKPLDSEEFQAQLSQVLGGQ